MPQLALPNSKYKNSYLEAVKEYQEENQHNYIHLDIEVLEKKFGDYVQKILQESDGIGLPEGYVPHTVFWLVEKDRFLGRVDIRHELNDFLKNVGGHIGYDIRPSERKKGYGTIALSLALDEAKKIGIHEILVTCDIDNIGSNKIIQKNGGTLLPNKNSNEHAEKNRYIIQA